MNCPNCGAPMRVYGDALKCDFCQTIQVPDKGHDGVRVLAESLDHLCPVCNVTLMKATLLATPLLYCTQCRGMAIPMQVFPALIANLEAQPGVSSRTPSAPDLTRKTACPNCHRRMDTHFYSGGPGNVVIDTCESCLLNWLDTGELARIADAPDTFASAY